MSTAPAIDGEIRVCISIVSHRQGRLIRPLLADLTSLKEVIGEVILTLNVAEDESFYHDFTDLPLRIVRNEIPKGFGSNHNSAFTGSSAPFFVVVNPDIRLEKLDISRLVTVANQPLVGVAAPLVYSSDGWLQDSARRFPTIALLLHRRLGRKYVPDYVINDTQPMQVDWVAGMLMVFRSVVFREIGGFDDRFFMYFEDADLCRRLHLAGFQVLLCPQTQVVHDARRASRRNLRHFFWHFTSAWRYFAKERTPSK